jgi:predicted RNA methylase
VNALAIIKAAMKPRADAPTPSERPVSPVSPVLPVSPVFLVSPVSPVHQLPQVPGLPSVPGPRQALSAAPLYEWAVYVAPKGGDPDSPPPPALVRALGPGPAERAVATALGQPAERCMAVPRNPSLHADAVPLEHHPLALPNADDTGARLARLVNDPRNLTPEEAALAEVAAMERAFRGQFRTGNIGPHGEQLDDWAYVRAVAARMAEEQRRVRRPVAPRAPKPTRTPHPAPPPPDVIGARAAPGASMAMSFEMQFGDRPWKDKRRMLQQAQAIPGTLLHFHPYADALRAGDASTARADLDASLRHAMTEIHSGSGDPSGPEIYRAWRDDPEFRRWLTEWVWRRTNEAVQPPRPLPPDVIGARAAPGASMATSFEMQFGDRPWKDKRRMLQQAQAIPGTLLHFHPYADALRAGDASTARADLDASLRHAMTEILSGSGDPSGPEIYRAWRDDPEFRRWLTEWVWRRTNEAVRSPRPQGKRWIIARTSRPPNEVPDDVLDLLSEMTVDGSVLKRHPRQLTEDDHAALYKVLRALGATWKGGRTQGYVFQPGVNVPALIESVLTTGQYLNPRSFDFVETPRALADALCEQAHVVAGERALEPSAGKGSIADALRRRGAVVTMVELLEANAADLVAVRGFEPARVHQGDFLEMTLADLGGEPFDVVLMNPPFGTRPFIDIEHVLHAFDMVRPGGRLVAVMSKGVQYRRAPKAQRFRVFASHHGTMENLPDGSFAASGTNARAVLVTLHRGENERLRLGMIR